MKETPFDKNCRLEHLSFELWRTKFTHFRAALTDVNHRQINRGQFLLSTSGYILNLRIKKSRKKKDTDFRLSSTLRTGDINIDLKKSEAHFKGKSQGTI